MADAYKLMHKNDLCGVLSLDEDAGYLIEYKNLSDKSPYLGNADTRLMKRWWEARAIPASRKAMQEIIRQSGCVSGKEYLAKNLALSMTDAYWICPVDMNLTWSDVNLHDLPFFAENKLPYHNATSYDPNASLGGQMEKYWDFSNAAPVLVKTAYREYGQQAVNEIFASRLHELQNTTFPYVKYELRPGHDNGLQTLCTAFTTAQTEMISALEILDSQKLPNDMSLYDAFIQIGSGHGIDENYMRDYMDYLTMTDFIISNTDEHLMNYGILRNTDTLAFTAPAPIFDSGNSMFFDLKGNKPLSRTGLLERKINAIHNSEEAMLKHVSNRSLVKADLLPSPEEVSRFYQSHGIPEQKAAFIAGSYHNKLALFQDFQHGKTISLYHERQNAKNKL